MEDGVSLFLMPKNLIPEEHVESLLNLCNAHGACGQSLSIHCLRALAL